MRKLEAGLLAAVIALTCAGCSEPTVSEGQSVAEVTSSAVTVVTSAVQEEIPDESIAADSTSAPMTEQQIPEDTVTESTTTAAATSSSAALSAESTTAAATAPPKEIIAPEEKPQEKTLAVSCTVANTWQEDGMECSQVDVVITNNTGAPTEKWSIKLDLGQQAEIMQSWNVSISSQGDTVLAANVDYNGSIAEGGETTFGFIVKTAKPITSFSANGGAGSAPSQQKPQTTTATAATTTAAPKPQQPVIEATNRAGLVSVHGQLSVKGTDLVDKNGKPVQLRGVSTHGIQWFPAFANKEVFRYLRDEWKINVIRLAMYSGAGEGYTDATKAGIEQTVQNAVDAAIELDMYVIVDWHVLQDQSPQVRKADSLRFFKYMSEKYADYPNIIYEICNEPNGYATWSGDVKPYAEEVIPVIRANDPDSVIIVGTPTWSQDIDKALADPLSYENVMYALHYYAATHTDWLRDRLKSCYNSGLPVMVTEFGNCDASGNGRNDFEQGRKWLELLDSLNISYMNWSLCDKAEAASLLKPGASPTGGWNDSNLTDNGKFMRDWFVNHS